MMTPTLVPTLVVYQDLIIGGSGNKSGFFLIVFGFLLIWLTYSFLVSVLQIIFLVGVARTMIFHQKKIIYNEIETTLFLTKISKVS